METDRIVFPSDDQHARSVLAEFDWTASESASAAVVQALASIIDVEPTALPPLYEVIDPDALDALLTHDPPGPEQRRIGVSFTYDDYRAVLRSSGTGYIVPSDPEADAAHDR